MFNGANRFSAFRYYQRSVFEAIIIYQFYYENRIYAGACMSVCAELLIFPIDFLIFFFTSDDVCDRKRQSDIKIR